MWVLIVVIFTYGSNGGSVVSMQEFGSKERCLLAQTHIEFAFKDASGIAGRPLVVKCIEK